MNKLVKKFNNKEGFTLIEMLIVVAIIAILIAISIPVVNKSLEKARQATDNANGRSAKAAMLIEYMETEKSTEGYYDATKGQVANSNSGIKGYGQTTANKNMIIKVGVNDEGEVSTTWTSAATGG